jgi:L-ascorbate metabolism protein UlaG (beta-lactamase superfamily)
MDEKFRIDPHKVMWLLFIIIALLCSCSAGNLTSLETSRNTVIHNQNTSEEEIEITFISNAGFLIGSDDKKILVDALWDSSGGDSVPREVKTLMEQALPPFDNVDLVLTTHVHADHFNASVVGKHLENNLNAIFVSREEVVQRLELSFPRFDSLQDRVRTVQPEEGERILLSLNGIDIEVLNLHHGIDVPVRNNAYLFTIGGLKLFHTGDIGVTFEEIQVYELFNDEIDIVFIPYFFMTYEDERIVKEGINAKRIIPMHIRPNSGGYILEQIDEEYPEAIVFYEKMQTIVVSSPLEEIEKQIEEEQEEGEQELPEEGGICLGTSLLLSMLATGITFRKREKNQ